MATLLITDELSESRQTPREIEVPAPTAWPFVLAFGCTLLFSGLVTNISVSLNGLQPDMEYLASWSPTVACDMGTLAPDGAFYRFRGSKRGTASFRQSVSTPLSSIHSIAIQMDTNGSGLVLVACAPVN